MLATIIKFFASYAIAALMLGVGLRASRSVFHDFSRRWKVVARALVVVWIAVPLLALVAIMVLRPNPIGAGVLAIMAICPGVPLLMRRVGKARGDTDTALLIMISTLLSSVILLPVWAIIVSRLTPFSIAIEPTTVAIMVLASVIVPFVLGRIIYELSPAFALRLAKFTNAVFLVGIAVAAVALLAAGIPGVRELTLRGLVAAVVIVLGAAAIGYLAGGPRRPDRISLGYAAALGNPALALAVIAQSYPEVYALTAVAIFIVIRALALIPFGIWLKRGGTAQHPPGDAALAGAR